MFIRINDQIINKSFINRVLLFDNLSEFIATFWLKDSNDEEISISVKMKKSNVPKFIGLDDFINYIYLAINEAYGGNCTTIKDSL